MTNSEKIKLIELLSKDKLREVTDELLKLALTNEEYILVAAQMSGYEDKVHKGVTRQDDLELIRNQLRNTLLKLVNQIEVNETETQHEAIYETGETSTAGEVNVSFSTSNSNEMDAYKFYFAMRDQLLGFIEDSDNRRLGIYQDDQDTAESVSQIMTVLSKLQKHLKVNQLSASLLFEVVEEALTMLVSADEELMNLVLGQKISTNGLKLKIINIQKKIADIVSEIDKKLQIDTASEG